MGPPGIPSEGGLMCVVAIIIGAIHFVKRTPNRIAGILDIGLAIFVLGYFTPIVVRYGMPGDVFFVITFGAPFSIIILGALLIRKQEVKLDQEPTPIPEPSQLSERPPSLVPPFKRSSWGTSFFVIGLLARWIMVTNQSFSLGWYFGWIDLPYGGPAKIITFIDWINRILQGSWPLQFQIHTVLTIDTLLISIVLLYALARKDRILVRYLSLGLLLPLLSNLLILFVSQPQPIKPQDIMTIWFNYRSTGNSYSISINFGDFLLAASAIILFRASRK